LIVIDKAFGAETAAEKAPKAKFTHETLGHINEKNSR
jgi:hypothetical protein